ncbi:hypothetical protein AAE478_009755 [Parahypoxylon ruwenzoriense]
MLYTRDLFSVPTAKKDEGELQDFRLSRSETHDLGQQLEITMEYEEHEHGTRRSIKTRIGTGLFVGLDQALVVAGPGFLLAA